MLSASSACLIGEPNAPESCSDIILPGVTIGDGCSVGAGSLVTKDLPPWSLCYGSPCRVIEQKKSKEIRLQMEKEFLQEYEKGQKND